MSIWFVLAAWLVVFPGPARSGQERPRNASAGLRLATFCCDVTPPVDGHPLIWVLPMKTVEDPLLAKGVVLDDGNRR
jgi:hypothetical protein